MYIKFTQNVNFEGVNYTADSESKAVTAETGASLIAAGLAVEVDEERTNVTYSAAEGLMGPGGAILKGPMVSGEWFSTPSVFRLRITGTGTVSIDAKDSLGNITLAVATYTATSATDQIEFPYAGDNAVAIRATLTGTATVEVI